jgi:hypothetical protein
VALFFIECLVSEERCHAVFVVMPRDGPWSNAGANLSIVSAFLYIPMHRRGVGSQNHRILQIVIKASSQVELAESRVTD